MVAPWFCSVKATCFAGALRAALTNQNQGAILVSAGTEKQPF